MESINNRQTVANEIIFKAKRVDNARGDILKRLTMVRVAKKNLKAMLAWSEENMGKGSYHSVNSRRYQRGDLFDS